VYIPNGRFNRYPILSRVCEEIKKMKLKRNLDHVNLIPQWGIKFTCSLFL
jgi:hypothetical protein